MDTINEDAELTDDQTQNDLTAGDEDETSAADSDDDDDDEGGGVRGKNKRRQGDDDDCNDDRVSSDTKYIKKKNKYIFQLYFVWDRIHH